LVFRDCWATVTAFVGICLGVALVLVLQGTSLKAAFNSLVLLIFRMFVTSKAWYIPLDLGWWWIPWAVGGFAIAIFVTRRNRSPSAHESNFLFFLKSACAIFFVLIAFCSKPALIGCVTPFSWFVLFPPSEELRTSQSLPRALLCVITVLQVLYAYPIAGSQASFIQVLPAVVAFVCLGDSFVWARDKFWNPHFITALLRPVAIVSLALISASYLLDGYRWHVAYQSLPSLCLPGAERIHVPESQRRDLQWVTRNLSEHCDVFEGFPGLPSFNFWTRKEPLTGLNNGGWILSHSDEQQMRMVSALSTHPKACIVYNPSLVAFWNRTNHNIDDQPLVRFIHENFKTAAGFDGYYILVRKERDLPITSGIRLDLGHLSVDKRVNYQWRSKIFS